MNMQKLEILNTKYRKMCEEQCHRKIVCLLENVNCGKSFVWFCTKLDKPL